MAETIDEFVAQLHGPTWEDDRRIGAANLSKQGEKGLDVLLVALTDTSFQVRAAAAWGLGKLGYMRAFRPLLDVLADEKEHEEVRYHAACALGELRDDRALTPLIAAFHRPNTALRRGATYAFAFFEPEQVLDLLIAALSDPAEIVRLEAAQSFGILNDHRAVDLLIPHLTDPSHMVQLAVGQALGDLRDPAAIPALLDLFAHGDDHATAVAINGLWRIGDAAIPPLIVALAHPNWQIRAGAAQALGQINDAGGIAALKQLLEDDNETVRDTIRTVSTRLVQAEKVRQHWMKNLNSTNTTLRLLARIKVAKGSDEKSVLVEALNDPDSSIRQAAVAKLEFYERAWAQSRLMEAVDDPEVTVACSAIEVLGRMGSPHMLTFLRDVSRSAVKGLDVQKRQEAIANAITLIAARYSE